MTCRIVVGGPLVAVAVEHAGQSARLKFGGTEGRRVRLGIGDVDFGGGPGAFDVSILAPDGTTVAAKTGSISGAVIHVDALPETGTYTISIVPENAATMDAVATLTEAFAGILTSDGPPLDVSLRPGQDARVTFDATPGQLIRLEISDVTFGSVTTR